HQNFKEVVVKANEGDTVLTLKELTPVRLIKNEFYKKVAEAEARCASIEELKEILGRARAKKGMFEGDLVEGELEIGQISALIKEIKPAAEIVKEIVEEYNTTLKQINSLYL
ncbi:MAG: NAD(P)H-dependent flavin oxidoreductase, partial [Bacteroidia bacterium]